MSDNSSEFGSQFYNVPNQLSMLRLVLCVVLFVLLPLHFFWAGIVVFVVAAVTDFIDGWWARRFKQVTQLGRMLDPFADKILVCGTFILLAVEMRDRFPWWAQVAGWMAVVIVARELLVTGLRGFVEHAGGDMSAKMPGKLKMWFQCIAAVACLLALGWWARGIDTPMWLLIVMAISIWLAVISTIWSAWYYVVAGWLWVTGRLSSSGVTV